MTTPPLPIDSAAAARSGRAWWMARAALAATRTRRFATRWSGGMGVIVAVALVLPFAIDDGAAADRARADRLTADTLRLGQRRRTAERTVARAESVLVAARAPSVPVTVPRPRVVPPAPASTAPTSEFARLIADARRLNSVESVLAVASHPAVSAGPRMRAMADSLRTLETVRRARTSDEAARAIVRVRLTILSIAETRQRELGPSAPAAQQPASPATVAGLRVPDVAPQDTAALVAAWQAARDSLVVAQRSLDSSVRLLREMERGASTATRSGLTRFTPALLFIVVLLGGLLVRFLAALRQETRTPTVADAAEAEQLTGMRILAVVRDAPLDGPARFKPSGVDPFRMLYLGLTATGTRARTAVVTGAEPEIAAAVGARLAIAAAADHRNTLILDCDPTQIAVSRTFRERAEPGLSDVLAKAFAWREVARPVGSSDGLPITLLPAGTERDDAVTGTEREVVQHEFSRLRASYELTLAVASPRGVEDALALIESSPVLFTVVVGETKIDQLLADLALLRAAGQKLQGLVLWSAPPPVLPTRAELAAMLSTRKGRTPGGSFTAVQKFVGDDKAKNRT